MRKLKDANSKSPRPKIKLKSPEFKTRLKINSPKYEPPSKHFEKAKKLSSNAESVKHFFFIPEEGVISVLAPFRKFFPKETNFLQ